MSAKMFSAPMAIVMLLLCLLRSSSVADPQGIPELEPGEYLLQVNRHASKEVEGLPYTLSVDQIPPVSPEEVRQALDKALDYLISQQGEDGAWRELKAEIPGTDLIVRTKEGFYAR